MINSSIRETREFRNNRALRNEPGFENMVNLHRMRIPRTDDVRPPQFVCCARVSSDGQADDGDATSSFEKQVSEESFN